MIDILLAVYNGEKYLKAQLDSIFSQTFKDFKIIIGDDNSSDSTYDIIKDYIKRFPGKIEYHKNEENSGSPARNFFSLVKHSSAEFMMTCDHDDVWLPEKVALTFDKMKKLQENKGKNTPLLVHTDLKVVDENLKQISPSMFSLQKLNKEAKSLRELIVQNNVTGCTMMINRSLAEKVEFMPKEALMHDWWFALVAAAFGEIDFVDKSTILYRQHSSNQVGAKSVGELSFLAKRMSQKEEIKKAIYGTIEQAQKFLEVFEKTLNEEDKHILKEYVSIKEKNKINKIATLLRGSYLKYGLVRKVGQILYI